MAHFAIVTHRGITTKAPENTVAAFQAAVELGADAIELDVRLTADQVLVVYHYYYLDGATTGRGPIFAFTLDQLRDLRVLDRSNPDSPGEKIPTLYEVLERFVGRIGLEIEIKGPEPEAPAIVAAALQRFIQHWPMLEVTSYEPAFLLEMRRLCPGLAVDLLVPRSEPWMNLDVVAYQACHRARLAQARAVHMHPTQLSAEVVQGIRERGIDVHAWDVNDDAGLRTAAAFDILRVCTDDFPRACAYRKQAGS